MCAQDDSVQLVTLYTDIMDTVSVRLTEEHSQRVLSSSLYGKWKELKSARKEQGFTCTPARLHAREVDRRGGIDADGGNQTGGVAATGMKAKLLEKQKKDAGVDSRDMGEVVGELRRALTWLSTMVMKQELYKMEKARKEAAELDELDGAGDNNDDDEKKEATSSSSLTALVDVSMASFKRSQNEEEQKVDLLLEACESLLPTSGADYVLRLSNDEQVRCARESDLRHPPHVCGTPPPPLFAPPHTCV